MNELEEGVKNEVISKKQVALEKAGATREASYKAMVEGLSSETMVVDKFGREHTAPDTTGRLRAAELISRLHGDLKEGVTVDNRQVHIHASSDEVATLIAVVADVRQQLDGLKTNGHQTGEIIDVSGTVRDTK